MTYTVIWEPQAENDLASVWLAALDRAAVNLAAQRLDQELSRNP
jgi:hypothetical protein